MPSVPETPRRPQRLKSLGVALFGIGVVAAAALLLTVEPSTRQTIPTCAPGTTHELRPHAFRLRPYPMVTLTDGCGELTYDHPAWFASYLAAAGLVSVLIGVVDESRDGVDTGGRMP